MKNKSIRVPHNAFRGIALLFLFVALAALMDKSFAQATIKLSVNKVDYSIEALSGSSVPYVSLSDFAAKLHIQFFKNQDKGKIELRLQSISLIFTANNPFLVLRSREDATVKAIQMGEPTLTEKDILYVPLSELSAVLSEHASMVVKWDAAVPDKKQEEKEVENAAEEAPSYAVFSYTVNEKANGTLITFSSKQKIKKYSSSVKDGNLVIEFPGVQLTSLPKPYSGRKGTVREVTWSQEKKSAIVIVSLSSESAAHEFIEEGDKTLLLTVHNQKFAGKKNASDPARQKWKFDVLVIDAGHGGKDYGAIGVHNTVEKQINLGVALKLGKMVQQNMKDVKVVYTRKDDSFIELYKRGKIANENNGKLFISIHCNSVQAKVGGPNGYEIYLLRPGRTAEAINIAERENSVISYEDKPSRYGKLTDENFILVSMAHSSYMRYSEKFAEILDGHLKNGSKITSRGIKQAGFYVLVGAAMPSILFETGYVTNESDAAYMRSDEGQKDIANSIFQAIKSFKGYYAREIEAE